MGTFNRVIRTGHVFLGLLSFTQFLIYGVAGVTAALQTTHERPKIPAAVRYVPFEPGLMETDQQVALRAYNLLNLPFTRPMPDWYLRHTPDRHLLLDFYNINGIYRVTVLEQEHRVRIEDIRNSPWLFLEDIHASRAEPGGHFLLIRLWSYYNEFAMWTLTLMTLSGAYLWLTSRIRSVHGWMAIVAPLLLVYGLSAIQIQHNSWFLPRRILSTAQVQLSPGIDGARKVAAILDEKGIAQGELEWSLYAPSGISLRIGRPGVAYDAVYSPETGMVTTKTTTTGILGLLNGLHRTAGMWRQYGPLRWWNALVILISSALILAGFTGVQLWFQRRRYRLAGAILLAANLSCSLMLLILIRLPQLSLH